MNHDITSCVMPVPENSLRFFISVNVYVTTDDYVVTDLNFWHGILEIFQWTTEDMVETKPFPLCNEENTSVHLCSVFHSMVLWYSETWFNG